MTSVGSGGSGSGPAAQSASSTLRESYSSRKKCNKSIGLGSINRLNKCGVVSPRFHVGVNEIESLTASLLPSR